MDLATAARAAFERRKAWESGGEVCIMAANRRRVGKRFSYRLANPAETAISEITEIGAESWP
jgi:hypothetical protein